MCFDVPKVVRSPKCDHGHDEESRNSRYINIHILEGYIRTPEWFWSFRISFGVPGVTGPPPPGRLMGHMGPKWSKGGAARAGRAPPPPLVRIEQGGGGAPLSFLSPSSFPLLLQQGKVGVGLLLASRLSPPLAPLYTGARGTP